jgi:hypothetical protein
VIAVLVHPGAFGTPRGLSYTLYYATTFMFYRAGGGGGFSWRAVQYWR